MATAAHVKTARTKGAQAGFDEMIESFVRVTNNGKNGLEPVRDALAEVRKVGGYVKSTDTWKKPEKALEWYCARFEVEPTAPKQKRTRKASASTTPDMGAIVAQAVAAALAAAGVASDTDENDEDENDEPEVVTEKPSKYAPSASTADDPATNGRLWKLNQEGLLQILDADEAGDPITNAEAHEALAEVLS